MDLRKWMEATDLDIYETARAFGVSIHAVRKWLRGERIPRSAMQSKIKKVSKGQVSGDDWLPRE